MLSASARVIPSLGKSKTLSNTSAYGLELDLNLAILSLFYAHGKKPGGTGDDWRSGRLTGTILYRSRSRRGGLGMSALRLPMMRLTLQCHQALTGGAGYAGLAYDIFQTNVRSAFAKDRLA